LNSLETKKIENIKNIEFIKEYLKRTNLSSRIISHPRFDSILWKISSLIRKADVRAFSQEAINLLNSILVIKADGSISIFENKGKNAFVSSTKYYFNEEDMKLRKILCEPKIDGTEENWVSTYDEDGIEESLMLEQKWPNGSKYYAKTVRVPGRIDMIRIERIEEENGSRERMEDIYQLRTFCVAYEDINPGIDEIDPLDAIHMSLLGVPPIYRDLEPDELEVIEECDGEVFPLDDESKEKQLMDCIETNKFYGRTRKFEGAIAKYLDIEDRLPSNEHPI
jgi:hypothetical protein